MASIILLLFIYIKEANATNINFSCRSHENSGAVVDTIHVSIPMSKELTETIPISAIIKKIKIGKTIYKNLNFKGERSYSTRGPYYELESSPPHKKIKSIIISANPSGLEDGQDRVITVDKIVYKISCREK